MLQINSESKFKPKFLAAPPKSKHASMNKRTKVTQYIRGHKMVEAPGQCLYYLLR